MIEEVDHIAEFDDVGLRDMECLTMLTGRVEAENPHTQVMAWGTRKMAAATQPLDACFKAQAQSTRLSNDGVGSKD